MFQKNIKKRVENGFKKKKKNYQIIIKCYLKSKYPVFKMLKKQN